MRLGPVRIPQEEAMADQNIAVIAGEHFAAGCNCAQAVLRCFADRYGLDADTAVRLATGFGVGMGRGGACGAVSGAVMALGLAGGGGGPDGAAAKAATYDRARAFYDRFLERHGSLICRDLMGLDPSTPDGLEQARREGRFADRCSRFVGDAAAIAAAMIESLPPRA
jgi:C_GCAxxG_C_C family probable redox protein